MVKEHQEKWDRKHASQLETGEPAAFLQRIFQLPACPIGPGKVLDIASGKGRNALYLAEKGFHVEAIDISEVALMETQRQAAARGLTLNVRQVDLDSAELPERAYDLILNFNFLQRSLIPKIKLALKLGGYVVFETYLIDQRVLGHPGNPAYLLGHNELLRLFQDFRVLYYREGKFDEEGQEAFRAGLLAQKLR